MPDFFSFINSVLWGSVMIYLLFGAGCWFTFRTGFVQFRYIRQFGKSLKNSIHPQPGGLTSFQSLCTSLAARVGSGNLAGVALAITAGGPGAVFWMWVAAFIGMATSFAECSLAQLYKERDANGQFRGGPAHAGVCPVDGDNLGTDLPGDLRNEYRATSPRHLVYF